MALTQSQSETISLTFEKFWMLVNVQVRAYCGLNLNDIEDFDIEDYYPGPEAQRYDYVIGIKDAAAAAIENSLGFNIVTMEDEE